MTLAKLLLLAAQALAPPWYAGDTNPETPEAYQKRLVVITESVSKGTEFHVKPGKLLPVSPYGWRGGRKLLAAAELANMYEESKFALEVHAGTDHPVWTQDRGMARCLSQLWATGLVQTHEWELLAGTSPEATLRCSQATVRVLASLQRYCVPHGSKPDTREALVATFSALSGKGCAPTKAGRRKYATFAKIWRIIR